MSGIIPEGSQWPEIPLLDRNHVENRKGKKKDEKSLMVRSTWKSARFFLFLTLYLALPPDNALEQLRSSRLPFLAFPTREETVNGLVPDKCRSDISCQHGVTGVSQVPCESSQATKRLGLIHRSPRIQRLGNRIKSQGKWFGEWPDDNRPATGIVIPASLGGLYLDLDQLRSRKRTLSYPVAFFLLFYFSFPPTFAFFFWFPLFLRA